MTEQLSRERLHTIIRMVVSARGPKVADEIADHIIALEAENAEWKASFDLYNKAIRRGDDAWRQAHPDMDCYPDTGEMVKWLCDRNDALEAENERLRDEQPRANHEIIQALTDEVETLRAENERLRGLGKEVVHDSQALSQNNMDLRKRNALLEKVAEAAYIACQGPEFYGQKELADALAELEAPDDPR